MTYKNLKAEMVKYGVTQQKAAKLLSMSVNNFSMKIREKVPFTVSEIKRIRGTYFPDATLDYLLESDGDVPTEREQLHHYADAIGNSLTKDGAEPDEEADEIVKLFHDCAEAVPSSALADERKAG